MTSPTETPTRNPSWDLFWALREQWTHEDTLINYRSMWLILSQGLLLTAYGVLSKTEFYWVTFGLPALGLAVTLLVGSSIYAAIKAAEAIRRRFDAAGLAALCQLIPDWRHRTNGLRATRALPYVFVAIWLLALAGATRTLHG